MRHTCWLILLLAVGCRQMHSPRGAAPEPPPAALDTDAVQRVIDATNAERRRAGVPPLTPDPQLTAAADAHARNMARQNRMSHTLDGESASDRVKVAGYRYRTVGENIAWNQPTADTVVDDWMHSRGHRRNMLSGDFTQIGVAVATNRQGEPYWVQVFGTPR